MARKKETVHERLKRLRLERGMTQRELASGGVSYAYISRIEAGARTPSVKALRRLAERLDVTVEYLEFGDDGVPTYPQVERVMAALATVLADLGLESIHTDRVDDIVIVDGVATELGIEIPETEAIEEIESTATVALVG